MKIYLSLVSLGSLLASRRLALADAPAFCVDHGFEGIEILDRQIADLGNAALVTLRETCNRLGCGVVLDTGCDLTDSRPGAAECELARLERVVEQAETLGCSVLRVAPGGQRFSIQKLLRRGGGQEAVGGGRKTTLASHHWVRRAGYFYRSRFSNFGRYDDGTFDRVIDSFNRILPFARERGISLAIENHWGIVARPEWILRIVDGVAYSGLGTCPDFGNFPSRVDRYAGLAALAPRALHVQAKCWSFRKDGKERSIDFGRCLGILKQAGYEGPVAVEYEGGGDEIGACTRARQLILGSL